MDKYILDGVLDKQKEHESTWRWAGDSYWYSRVMQQMSFLGELLIEGKEGDEIYIDRYLYTLASIFLNWIDKRSEFLVVTEEHYEAAMQRVDDLWDSTDPRKQHSLQRLVDAVEAYEAIHHIIPPPSRKDKVIYWLSKKGVIK